MSSSEFELGDDGDGDDDELVLDTELELETGRYVRGSSTRLDAERRRFMSAIDAALTFFTATNTKTYPPFVSMHIDPAEIDRKRLDYDHSLFRYSYWCFSTR